MKTLQRSFYIIALKEKPKIQLEDFASMIDFEEKEIVSGITEMEFSKMLPFPNRKFKLYEGSRLSDMTESIKTHGILAPIILWHNENDKYIILSGHNRKSAGILAGHVKAPAYTLIVRNDHHVDFQNLHPELAEMINTFETYSIDKQENQEQSTSLPSCHYRFSGSIYSTNFWLLLG